MKQIVLMLVVLGVLTGCYTRMPQVMAPEYNPTRGWQVGAMQRDAFQRSEEDYCEYVQRRFDFYFAESCVTLEREKNSVVSVSLKEHLPAGYLPLLGLGPNGDDLGYQFELLLVNPLWHTQMLYTQSWPTVEEYRTFIQRVFPNGDYTRFVTASALPFHNPQIHQPRVTLEGQQCIETPIGLYPVYQLKTIDKRYGYPLLSLFTVLEYPVSKRFPAGRVVTLQLTWDPGQAQPADQPVVPAAVYQALGGQLGAFIQQTSGTESIRPLSKAPLVMKVFPQPCARTVIKESRKVLAHR